MAAALAAVASLNCPAAEIRFDASLREQLEHVSDDVFGAGGTRDDVAQHRLLVSLDGRPFPSLRTFLELGAYAQNGRNGGSSPVDESDPDLHQGIVEWRPQNGPLQLSLGRQEWTLGSGRLISVRDGPNIRRTFDGARLDTQLAAFQLRAFWGRPVRNEPEAFDDRARRAEHLSGLQLAIPLAGAVGAEIYALDYARDQARFAQGLADEDRRSFGLRLHGRRGRFDFNSEAVWQSGHWGDARIRAWTLANDFGWQATAGDALRPRLGLKADLASGDRHAGDGRLETFNALYPNPSYFSDASLIAPANLIDLQPHLSLGLPRGLSLHAGWNLLWKHREADAVYTTPVPLAPVADSTGRARFIGHQWQLSARQILGGHMSVEASYVRFEPGKGLSGLQDGGIDFLQLVLTLGIP